MIVNSIEIDLKTVCLDEVVKRECIQSTKGDSDLSLGPSLHCKSEEEDLRRGKTRREITETDEEKI